MHAHRYYPRVDVPVAWMLEDIDLPCTLPLPEPGDDAVPVLAQALRDEEPLIRGHAAWALGRIGTGEAVAALRGREGEEEDAWVREEIVLTLE